MDKNNAFGTPQFQELLEKCNEAQYVLSFPPLALLVRRPPGELDSDELTDNPVQRVPIVTRSWSPDRAGNVHVYRKGFQCVPNFSGTIHSFVGASLDAAMLDCLHFAKTPTREDMLKAYLGISRVRTKEGLLIVQPYHPMLFRRLGCCLNILRHESRASK